MVAPSFIAEKGYLHIGGDRNAAASVSGIEKLTVDLKVCTRSLPNFFALKCEYGSSVVFLTRKDEYGSSSVLLCCFEYQKVSHIRSQLSVSRKTL